jgi:serine/threonine-protein kinase
MKITLSVIAGPHAGKAFEFDGHDTLLVGRTADAHLQIPPGDPYFSRRHFLVEVNPPRCRLIDLNSRNGTLRNGVRVQAADVQDGDEIGAGHTVFKVRILAPEPDRVETLDLPAPPDQSGRTGAYKVGGILIPGYRVEEEIGRGGMGVVYRATREKDGRPVAVKTIIPAAKATPKQVERFVRECRILAELDHPNIVACREVGEAGGAVFLVMDLVDGPDLATRLKERGPEDVRAGVRIVCHILAGLAHAHAKGFVHRDVKPANVLVGRYGPKQVAKLADFGLARVYEASRLSGLTMQGEMGGTPAFMAPEQVTHYRSVKPPADQYAAAATLYRILTGHFTHDFPKDTGAQIAMLVTGKPVPVVERRPDLSAGLAAVIHRALSREPDGRYPDVLVFRKELTQFA